MRCLVSKELLTRVTTDDLHGQWDYNNSFADPGCPGKGCLLGELPEFEIVVAGGAIFRQLRPHHVLYQSEQLENFPTQNTNLIELWPLTKATVVVLR